MKFIRDLTVGSALTALMMAILCFGCATSGSKRSGGTNQLQTASAQQPVILVPVFILSPPGDDKQGKDHLPAPDPAPPVQSIDGSPTPPPEPPIHI
jgi:hypothetical protein